MTKDEGDRNLEILIADLRPYADRPIGSLRIDMADVRSILALYDGRCPIPTSADNALREAAKAIQMLKRSIMIDVGSCHANRGPGASSEMRSDDREMRRDMEKAFALIDAALASSPAAEAEPVAFRYVHHDYAGRKVSRYGTHPERVNGHDPIEVHPLYAAPVSPTPASVAGEADPLEVGFWKEKAEHAERERDVWKERAMDLRLSKPTPVEAGALRPDRDVIAYSIIEGSAGIRAAEHAKDFQTQNWTDALRSADAVIAILAALSQPGSSESGGFEREIETSDGRLVTVRVALRQAAEAYAIARGNGHHGPGYNPVDVLRRAFLPSTPSSKER